MIDLHKAAQQALEALHEADTFHRNLPDQRARRLAAMAALRAVLAQPKSETCTWHQDGDSDSGVYATSCRRYFNLDDGTPEDNRMQWCCYCGKKLAQELIAEGGDD